MVFRRLMLLAGVLCWSSLAFGYDGNYALRFDGNDYVTMNSIATKMAGDGQFTITLWVKCDASSFAEASGVLLAVNENESDKSNVCILEVEKDDGELKLHMANNGSSENVYTGFIVGDDLWHYIVLSVGGTGPRSYISVDNGAHFFYTPIFSLKGDDLWSIGQEWDETGISGLFSGLIDEVCIWKRPLDDFEVQWNMSHKLFGNERDLAAYWDCDHEASGNIIDQTNNNYHARVYGADYTLSDFNLQIDNLEKPFDNSLSNWAFINNDILWENYDQCNLSIVTDDGYFGSNSLKCKQVENSQTGAFFILYKGTDAYNKVIQKEVTLSAWVKALSDNINIDYYINSVGNSLHLDVADGEWHQIELTTSVYEVTVPNIKITFLCTAGKEFLVDCVNLYSKNSVYSAASEITFPGRNYISNWDFEDGYANWKVENNSSYDGFLDAKYNCIEFDGIDDYIDSWELISEMPQSFTIYALFKPFSLDRDMAVLSSNSNPELMLGIRNGSYYFSIGQEGDLDYQILSSYVPSFHLNKWHSLLAKVDGGRIKLYVDEHLVSENHVDENTIPISITNFKAIVGCGYTSNDPFYGRIGCVKIFDNDLNDNVSLDDYDNIENQIVTLSLESNEKVRWFNDYISGNLVGVIMGMYDGAYKWVHDTDLSSISFTGNSAGRCFIYDNHQSTVHHSIENGSIFMNKYIRFSIWTYTDYDIEFTLDINGYGSKTYDGQTHGWVRLYTDRVKITQDILDDNDNKIECKITAACQYQGKEILPFFIDCALLEIDDDDILEEPVVVTKFIDDFGRVFQKQTWNGAGRDIVQGYIYNKLGQQVIVSKPLYISEEMEHHYIYDFWSKLNGYYLDLATAENGIHTNAYPYISYKYEVDHNNRVKKIISAGSELQAHPITYEYYFNDVNEPIIGTSNNEFICKESKSVNGVVNKIWMCNNGSKVINQLDCGSGGLDAKTIKNYDCRGNLTSIEPPLYTSNPSAVNSDNLIIKHAYNTLGQLLYSELPDAKGVVAGGQENDIFLNPDLSYKYDMSSRLRFIQDANQKQQCINGEYNCIFTAIDYDVFGRIIKKKLCILNEGTWNDIDDGAKVFDDSITIIRNKYDDMPDFSIEPWLHYTGDIPELKNISGKLSAIAFKNDATEGSEYGFTFYSYSDNGKLITIFQKLPTSIIKTFRIDYQYDTYGHIVEVNYNNLLDIFYTYDELSRLCKVGLTPGGNEYCKYIYNINNSLDCIEYYNADLQVIQKVKYTYNYHGLLTQINDLNDVDGVERDINGIPLLQYNQYFSERIDYFDHGYNDGESDAQYFNGNISRVKFKQLGYDQVDDLGYGYRFKYNNANMLTQADYITLFDEQQGVNVSGYDVYNVAYNYNGGISELFRNHGDASLNSHYVYNYNEGRNTLAGVECNMNVREYKYDANGNLIIDNYREFGQASSAVPGIQYNSLNLPVKIERNDGLNIQYIYDCNGNRVSKIISNQ